MSTLQIIKLESGTFKHVDSIDGEFFLGRFSFKQELGKAFLVEAYGAKRREYTILDISVFDYLGTVETFTNFTDLINRLTELGYTGIETNGILPTAASYISSDVGNALELGTDSKLFVPASSGDFLSNDETTYTAATLPLAGTELALVEQGGTFKKVAVSELGGGSGSLIRQQFVFSGSQTFTLSSNYGQVYSVSVQLGGALKDTQYTLVAPNQITILDTLDTDDYIVVLYSSSPVGLQPYYSQAEVDALLALKKNEFYSYKLVTPSIYATGTTSEIELVKITIPAYTFLSSDVIKIPSIIISKVGVNNAVAVRLKISTSPTMPAGPTGQIAQFTVNPTSLFQQVNRIFYINGGNLKGFPFTSAANSDIAAANVAMSSVAFDVTQTQYLYISCGLLSPLDSLRIECLHITNN